MIVHNIIFIFIYVLSTAFVVSPLRLSTPNNTVFSTVKPTKKSSILNSALKVEDSTWSLQVQKWFNEHHLCLNLRALLHNSEEANKILQAAQANVSESFEARSIELTIQELNASTKMVFRVIGSLNRLLSGHLRDLTSLRETSRQHLNLLHAETLREETLVQKIEEAETLLKKLIERNSTTPSHSLLGGIMKEISSSADKLQNDLSDHVFEKALKNPKFNRAKNVEAVIRVDGEGETEGTADLLDSSNNHTESHLAHRKGMAVATAENSHHRKKNVKGSTKTKVSTLIDSHDNTYVLSKGKDSTIPMDDKTFIMDIVFLILLSTCLAVVCQAVGLPTMFGHIIAGIILGPSCLGILRSVVQVETLGQFGVFFILFAVGLEFSPSKVRPLLKVSILGSLIPMLVMIGVCISLGRLLFNASTNESAFVGACLSLSSTPLIVNFLTEDRKEGQALTDYGRVLLAILIMQDVYLGLFMALLPSIAAADHANSARTADVIATYTIQCLRLFGILLIMVIVTGIILRFIARPVLNRCLDNGGREITILLLVSTAFASMLATWYLHVSMELGCFLAGVAFSGVPHAQLTEVEKLVQPLKDFLATVFFVSIGLHVFPKFLLYELSLLTVFTLAVVGCKFASAAIVLHFCLPRHLRSENDVLRNEVVTTESTDGLINEKLEIQTDEDLRRYKWLVSAGLAQVSEFSFVLGSSARKLGLCSREVYLIILGVTTLSLLLAPLLWKLVICCIHRARLLSSSNRSMHPVNTSFMARFSGMLPRFMSALWVENHEGGSPRSRDRKPLLPEKPASATV